MNARTQEVSLASERAPANVAAADGNTIMAVIARAAEDPNTDVDKLERLVGLYERITERQAEQSYNEAMNACQEAMRPVATDASNPQTKSKYASYAALDRALRPIYTRQGFAITFGTADGAPPEHVRVVARIGHRDGHKETEHVDMPADGKGAKGGDVMTKTHAMGAALSYGSRYLLKLIFNIAVGEDDDGNGNGGRDASPLFQRAVADLNSYETASDLALWKKTQAEGLERMLSPGEFKEVVALYNRRATSFKSGAAA